MQANLVAFTMHALLCDEHARFDNPFQPGMELRYVSRQFVLVVGDRCVRCDSIFLN